MTVTGSAAVEDATGGTTPSWPRLGLLWLVGADLRLTILAVPPVLPLIHRDLHLSETGVAALTGLPVFLLAAAAVLGSLLIARLSVARAATLGLLVVAVASALRGAGPSTPVLFGMTLCMGIGVSILQPALPALVGRWFSTRIPLATAVYANGLLVGETASASLTLPFVLPLVGGSWRWSFVVWAVPVLLTAFLLRLAGVAAPASAAVERRWWPDWKTAPTWRLGSILGGASAAYFGSNAFIPEFLHAAGRSSLIGPCLTALNAGQLPASLVVALLGTRLVERREPLLAAGLGIPAGLAGFLLLPGSGIAAGAAIIGFCTAFILILTLSLPPLLTTPDDVHRLSAGMFAIAYSFTFIIPLLGGAAWDASHVPVTSFLSVAAGGLTTLAAASGLRRRDARTA